MNFILRTLTERKEGTTLLHQPDARDNKEHHGSAQSLQIVLFVITVILSCVLVVVVILAAIFCPERCHKENSQPIKDVPAVHCNNRNEVVTIGAPSQGADGVGDSGTSDNNSDAVHSGQVYEAANLITNEDDHSPQISAALEERPQEASMPSEVPDIPITEADLVKLAKTIGPDWEAAGIQVLGITSADLDTFRANNPRNRNMQIFDMLNLWKRNQRKRAVTLRTLCELLTQAEVEYRVQLTQGE
ncbi:uncharacterized protein [Branchiostoma lanceolatum]|uniref:uncharacterized protein n=1 Tax=Branchiostoma lanceolatum TaxID=7740 RepID=UPI00345382C3